MAGHLPKRPGDRQGFKIGVICALSLEAGMVEMVFDHIWKKKEDGSRYGRAPNDPNAYTTGAIAGHNVVLAYCPDMGGHSAGQVASKMTNSFTGIKIIFVVGICGTVPFYTHQEEREEIVLGDCLISTGVVQFDYGRQGPRGFAKKDGLDGLGRASTQIRVLMTKLQTATNRQGLASSLSTHLQALHETNPKITYPGQHQDRLYKSSYVHTHQTPEEFCEDCNVSLGICAKDCSELGCDDRQLEHRDRLSLKVSPSIHFGYFGSSHSVLKSGLQRDQLAKTDKIIAFEMEAAGIWDICSTVVIKAACDYADSHKNKKWQSYSAAVAAAGLKAFLEELDLPDETEPFTDLAKMTPSLTRVTTGINHSNDTDYDFQGSTAYDGDHRHNHSAAEPRSQYTVRDVNAAEYMEQIPIPALQQTVRQTNSSAVNITAESLEWLTNSPEFVRWLSADESMFLWLRGPPGDGKTVAATYVHQDLLRWTTTTPNYDVVSIFCSQRDTEVGMLWALASQLSHRIDQVCAEEGNTVLPRFSKKHSRMLDLAKNLWDLLAVLINLNPQIDVFFIIDAIDQIAPRERSRFLQSFNSFEKRMQGKVVLRIFISSRDYPDIRESVNHYASIERGKEWKECLNSLYFEEWNARENKISDAQHGGSWLSSSEEYNGWLTSQRSNLLWIAGKPGSGKSTLTKLIAKRLLPRSQVINPVKPGSLSWTESNADPIISSFHYSFRGGQTESSHELMLRSIIYQILGQNSRLFAPVQYRFRNIRMREPQWSLEDLEAVLMSLHKTQHVKQIFIVIDGMDESDNPAREEILEFLSMLADSTGHCILRILIASRPESDIRPWMNRARHIFLEQMNRGDILAIITSGMQRLQQFQQATLDHQITAEEVQAQKEAFINAREYIVDNSRGVFLWVVLILKELESIVQTGGYSLDDIDDCLRRLPTELGDAQGLYAYMFRRLVQHVSGSGNYVARGRRIFAWVTFSRRQLLMSELRDALAVPARLIKDSKHKTFALTATRPNNLEQGLQSLCGGFIEMRTTNSILYNTPDTALQLMHQTAREFLLRRDRLAEPYDMNERFGDKEIAETCCRYIYLAFNAVFTQKEADIKDSMVEKMVNYLSDWVLLPYALDNLTFHLDHLVSESSETLSECRKLIRRVRASPVSYSSLLLHKWAQAQHWLLDKDTPLETDLSNNCLKHVLASAIRNKQENAISVMLSLKGDPNLALRIASQKDDVRLVEYLLGHGAEVDATDEKYRETALQVASHKGYQSLVTRLLDYGADINARGGHQGTALHAASEQGHLKMVELLLRKGADVNVEAGHYWTALQAASFQGHWHVVRLLLDSGADANVYGGHYDTALEAASLQGHLNVVELLLAHGGDYFPAMYLASYNGHMDVFELLLQSGADADDTALFLEQASVEGDVDMVKLLLAYGVDVNVDFGPISDYGNALEAASDQGNTPVIELLLGSGADIDAEGRCGTALQVASAKGHFDVVEMLLKFSRARTTAANTPLNLGEDFFEWP